MIEIRRPGRRRSPARRRFGSGPFGDEDAYIDYFYDHQDVSQVLLLLEDGVI